MQRIIYLMPQQPIGMCDNRACRQCVPVFTRSPLENQGPAAFAIGRVVFLNQANQYFLMPNILFEPRPSAELCA